MGDPGTFWLISPLLHRLETSNFFQVVVQRSYSVMVALTQKSFSPQYGCFYRGRSHIWSIRAIPTLESTDSMIIITKNELTSLTHSLYTCLKH